MTEYVRHMRKYIGHERLLIAGACVVIKQGQKLLLQKRRDSECWAFHGGCIELGETVEETAKREVLEETGLTVNKLEFINVFSGKKLFHTYPNGDMVSNLVITYLCEDFTGNELSKTDETLDLQWFGIDDLPVNISPPDKPILDFLRNQNNILGKL